MKRQLLMTGLLLIAPTMAFNAQAQDATNPETPEEQTEPTNAGTISSSGLYQFTSLQSIYAQESAVKLNTMYLENASLTGVYADQFTGIGNAGIVRSNVNINNISVYSGDVSSSTIKQTTHITGMEVTDSTIELNRVALY